MAKTADQPAGTYDRPWQTDPRVAGPMQAALYYNRKKNRERRLAQALGEPPVVLTADAPAATIIGGV